MYMALETVPVCSYMNEESQHLIVGRATLWYSPSSAAEILLKAASGDQCMKRHALSSS